MKYHGERVVCVTVCPENVDNHQFTYVLRYLLSSKKILTEVDFIDRVSEALKDLSVAMSDLALYF